LCADCFHARLNVACVACTIDDGGVFLADLDALGAAKILERGFFQRHAGFFRNHNTAGQNSHIFEHGLTTIAKARSLNGAGLENAADIIDHQSCKSFAFDIFGNNHQRTASFGNTFKHGE